MQTHNFTSGRIRRAAYDPSTQQLDLHWERQAITAYKGVPQEVYRRLCSAPNPAAYWEDRIAEEYPKATPMPRTGSDGIGSAAGPRLEDLFGSGDDVGENTGKG